MARHSIRLGGICVVMMGTVTAPAHAQALDDKYWVEVGAYWPSVSSHVRVAPASNPDGGTNIDLESMVVSPLFMQKKIESSVTGARQLRLAPQMKSIRPMRQ